MSVKQISQKGFAMPAKSVKQQQYMAMVAHGKIKGPKGLSKSEAMDFAETPTKNLPARVSSKSSTKKAGKK